MIFHLTRFKNANIVTDDIVFFISIIFLPESLGDVDGSGVPGEDHGQLAGQAPLAVPLLPQDKRGLSHRVQRALGSLD